MLHRRSRRAGPRRFDGSIRIPSGPVPAPGVYLRRYPHDHAQELCAGRRGAVVGSMLAVTSASAQTAATIPSITPTTNNNRNINVRVVTAGPAPTTVASIGVTVRCERLQGSPEIPAQALTAAFRPRAARPPSPSVCRPPRRAASTRSSRAPPPSCPTARGHLADRRRLDRALATPAAGDVAQFGTPPMSLGNGSVSEVIAVNAGTDAVFHRQLPAGHRPQGRAGHRAHRRLRLPDGHQLRATARPASSMARPPRPVACPTTVTSW